MDVAATARTCTASTKKSAFVDLAAWVTAALLTAVLSMNTTAGARTVGLTLLLRLLMAVVTTTGMCMARAKKSAFMGFTGGVTATLRTACASTVPSVRRGAGVVVGRQRRPLADRVTTAGLLPTVLVALVTAGLSMDATVDQDVG